MFYYVDVDKKIASLTDIENSSLEINSENQKLKRKILKRGNDPEKMHVYYGLGKIYLHKHIKKYNKEKIFINWYKHH